MQHLDDWMKNGLEEFGSYSEQDIVDATGKWQKISEQQDEDCCEQVFINTHLNKKVLVLNDEVLGFLADGNYVFHIHSLDQISVSDYDYFKQNGVWSDWELSQFVVFPSFVDEVASGAFVSHEDLQTTRDAFIALGFVEDPNFK